MTCRSWVCWRWTKKIVAPVIVMTADSATKPERGRRAIVLAAIGKFACVGGKDTHGKARAIVIR